MSGSADMGVMTSDHTADTIAVTTSEFCVPWPCRTALNSLTQLTVAHD